TASSTKSRSVVEADSPVAERLIIAVPINATSAAHQGGAAPYPLPIPYTNRPSGRPADGQSCRSISSLYRRRGSADRPLWGSGDQEPREEKMLREKEGVRTWPARRARGPAASGAPPWRDGRAPGPPRDGSPGSG